MMEGDMLGAQSKSMISMARMWEASSKARDSLLASRAKISERKELHFEIANVEKARDSGVITKESLKEKVRVLMHL